ncbi:hypothetical protein E2C01_074391 [Portunus trituberculatus]|uniref:Uncharacterized protein n=1 Tax=Portunus trituberculatus TaxID=210409 RepID=A0A5B7I391_PORTR|nr:hypothetical protein [Portunus trituberculatus]
MVTSTSSTSTTTTTLCIWDKLSPDNGRPLRHHFYEAYVQAVFVGRAPDQPGRAAAAHSGRGRQPPDPP